MDNCKIYAIANPKGGVGKITTTFNLGVALAKRGGKVLLVDADSQGDLTTCMDWTDLDKIQTTLADVMSRESVMRNTLSKYKDKYDYILIDCMPSLGMITINALACADKVIIPVQTQFLAAKGMGQFLQTISRVRKQINPNLMVDGVLLTLVDKRTTLPNQVRYELQESYGSKVKIYNTQIPMAVNVAKSTSHGESIFSYDKNSKVADSYTLFAKEVMENGKERNKNASTKDFTR